MTGTTIHRVAFLGDYLPRRCGIATFTADICEAVASEFAGCECIVGAVNDRPEGYDYPARIRFEIDEKEIDSYRRAADFLNINNVEVVSVQHEFGIYGGPAGSHLLAFLRDVHMPVVTTLHTVLREPTDVQRGVMKQLDQLSNRFIVMAEHGREMLETIYGVSPAKIDLIPHGVPNVQFIDPSFHKDQFGVEGKTVLLTFGLLSPNKGIEYVIEALPAILERHPNTVYIVLGATHPNLIAHEGECYRLKLERLAEDRGVSGSVIFYNRFVTIEELTDFIGAADIYVTPYLNEAQITSGTLAYAFGAGKAVISTPYWYAQELLADDLGILVPFADSAAIADGVDRFLSDPTLMNATRKRAWKIGREMIWPVVAQRYMESFERARASLSAPPRKAFAVRTLENRPYELPPLKLDHLFRMSDNTGIFQHAIFNVPNYAEGYCTDDNARAFILTLLLPEMTNRVARLDVAQLASTYLAFLWDAFNQDTCRFRNFMSHRREWLETAGSEDSHGRALWAAGMALGRSENEGHRNLCALLFQRGLPVVEHFTSPRAWAFVLLGDAGVSALLFGRPEREPTARIADPEIAGSLPHQRLERVAMVRAKRHLRQRQTFPRHDPERLLDLARGRARSGAPIPALAGGNAEIRSRTFHADRVQRLLVARDGVRPFRSAAARSLRDGFRVSRSPRAHAGRILAARRPALLRVVSGAQRSRTTALRFQHRWLPGLAASGSPEPEPRGGVQPRVLFIARGNDPGRSRADPKTQPL